MAAQEGRLKVFFLENMKRYQLQRAFVFCLAWAICLATAGGEPVVVVEGEAEVLPGETRDFSVVLPEMPEASRAVVEFTAWYQAPKAAGYYASLQVYWGETELMAILDRPAEFTIGDGRRFSLRGPNGWRVPLLKDAEAARRNRDRTDAYRIEGDAFDAARFRFELHAGAVGEPTLRIRNRVAAHLEAEGKPSLLRLRDITIHYLRK